MNQHTRKNLEKKKTFYAWYVEKLATCNEADEQEDDEDEQEDGEEEEQQAGNETAQNLAEKNKKS